MTKEQRQIKELTAANNELQTKLKDSEYWKEYYKNESSKKGDEINSVHTVLDSMGVPAKTKGEYAKELPLTARLTLFVSMIGLSSVIKVKNTLLDEETGF